MARITLSTACVAVGVGMAPLLWLPVLPGWGVSLALVGVGTVLLAACRRYEVRIVAVATISLGWALLNADEVVQTMYQLDGKTLNAEVTLVDMRIAEQPAAPLRVRVEKLDGRWVFPAFYARITPSPAMADWCGGQRWQLKVRLRPLHSRLNEGGFDSQRWGIAQRQLAQGRVMAAQPLTVACGLRQRLASEFEQHTRSFSAQPIMLALAFGEMKTLATETRALLQQTGTLHLMVISGLHVALAALFGWGLARGVQWGLPLHWIGYRGPLLVGVAVAWGYVWLAGGNPPGIRAALAFSAWAGLRWRGIDATAWQVWLACVALILLSDPLSILSSSLWLSCVAVAGLIFWFQWVPLPAHYRTGWRWEVLRLTHLQIGVMLLLLPLQWWLFHGISLTALPANLWAVPLVSFVTTPLVLLMLPLMPLPVLSHAVGWLADHSLSLVFAPLAWLRQGWLPLNDTFGFLSLLGWCGVVIWRFAWWRDYPATLMALVLFVVLQRGLALQPDWRVDMLDVGHGLAMVIERQGRAVLYDTGGQWPGGDMAQREILPYLRWRGLTPEAVILSHSHQDHVGGLSSLQQAYPALVVYSPFNHGGHRPCVQGEAWQWRNLTFTVLWPPRTVDYAQNNDSCVVRIDDGVHRVLLTGDIEAASERRLLATQREALSADLLQIPHHGSKTSSTAGFIRAVNPRYALASAARYSPWRLPATAVIQRYRQLGPHWADTARSGQISVRFFAQIWDVRRYREQLSPRWYHQWFGVQRDNE